MKNFITTLAFLAICTVNYAQTQDTLITIIGDTLSGLIRLDKDKNKFFFTGRSRFEQAISPYEIRTVITYLAEENYEKKVYYNVLNEFYLLQVENKMGLTLYANQTYSAQTNDGPRYYVVKNKYCIFKNGTPFFPIRDLFTEIMTYLTNDCFDLQLKIKAEIYKMEDIPTIVAEYNQCIRR
jgi:hypothetical protein